MASKDVISDETIVANHPWVEDVELELKKLEKEKKEKVDLAKQTFSSYKVDKVDDDNEE